MLQYKSNPLVGRPVHLFTAHVFASSSPNSIWQLNCWPLQLFIQNMLCTLQQKQQTAFSLYGKINKSNECRSKHTHSDESSGMASTVIERCLVNKLMRHSNVRAALTHHYHYYFVASIFRPLVAIRCALNVNCLQGAKMC